MTGSVIFLNLAGAVALLLWATRMVRTGVERAYGAALKTRLRLALTNGLTAAIAGAGLAIAMQSATAVALIVSGFVAGGYVGSGLGIAALLGADLGSALVTRILRLDLSLLVPVLFLLGTIAFRASEARAWRQAGRIMIGIGLLLLSLELIGHASEPLRDSQILPLVLNYLSRDWMSAFLLAAVMAWLFHSSIAAVLLVASLTDRDLIPPVLIIPMVLGINFGGAMIAAFLTRGMDRTARVVPLGNVLIRGLGAVAALMLQFAVQWDATGLAGTPGDAVVVAHIAFNAAIAALGIPVARYIPGFLDRILPPRQGGQGLSNKRVTALDEADLANPMLALGDAARELLSMCERIDLMLRRVFDFFHHPHDADIDALTRLDDEVDEIHAGIKFYLARIPQEDLDEAAMHRLNDILGAAIKLEQVADIIAQNLVAKVRKKDERKISFSEQGWRELSGIHAEVLKNARLTFNVLVSSDLETARELVHQKEAMRQLVQKSEARHLERLREGLPSSRETSSIHIDTIRDLKEINSLLVSIAYPVLEEAGMLRKNRLV